jgi:hypothetical protein
MKGFGIIFLLLVDFVVLLGLISFSTECLSAKDDIQNMIGLLSLGGIPLVFWVNHLMLRNNL